MRFEIIEDKLFGYTLEVNGEVLMECLSETDVSDLTIGEITELAKANGLI